MTTQPYSNTRALWQAPQLTLLKDGLETVHFGSHPGPDLTGSSSTSGSPV